MNRRRDFHGQRCNILLLEHLGSLLVDAWMLVMMEAIDGGGRNLGGGAGTDGRSKVCPAISAGHGRCRALSYNVHLQIMGQERQRGS